MSLDDAVEHVRAALIKRMGAKAYLQTKGLISGLAGDTGVPELTVRQALGRLSKDHWLDGVAADGTPMGQVRICGPVPKPPPDPAVERWNAVVEASGLSGEDRKVLLPLAQDLSDFNTEDLGHILDGLVRLRSSLSVEEGRHQFVVSAKYLLGSSKLLGELSGRALKAFGIDVNRFQTHPMYVVVAGPQNPTAVILVENPASFEMAVSTPALTHCAFVATFGFGLSKAQEDYGNQLADMVEDRFAHAITLRRDGSVCPDARVLLSHENIAFWGDLDLAGIDIYLRLKREISHLRLSELYKPMTVLLSRPEKSHPYIQAVGKDRQALMPRSELNGDSAASWLRGLCALRGVDQEAVSASDIESFAHSPLRMDSVNV